MTTNIINTAVTTSTPSKQQASFNTTTVLLVAGGMVAVAAALVNFKIALLLMLGVAIGAAYLEIKKLQDLSFDFELGNDLMTEVVAELEQRND